jgi:uncharacterized membrane protein
MEQLFEQIAGHIALAIEAVAILVITVGSIEAAVNLLRLAFSRVSAVESRAVWMRYAHWLVAGLTFQLAGDIVHSAIAPTWNEIGQLGAIAVIRTFLTYFLDRDLAEQSRLQREEMKTQR